MKNQKKKSFPRRVFLWLLAILLAVCIAFGVYVSDYYHADPAAEEQQQQTADALPFIIPCCMVNRLSSSRAVKFKTSARYRLPLRAFLSASISQPKLHTTGQAF